MQVLRLLVALYGRAPQPSWVNISQGLMFLDCPRDVAAVLDQLLRGSEDDKLLAYQIGFDLFENEMQSFTLQVPPPPRLPFPSPRAHSATPIHHH